MTLENEIGNGPLTFILILKSCGVEPLDLLLPSNAGDFGLGTNQNYTELIPTLNLICNSAQNRSYLLNLNLVRHKKEVRPLLFCIT